MLRHALRLLLALALCLAAQNSLADVYRWVDELGYPRLRDARGAMSLDNVADPHAFERTNYARVLDGWRPPKSEHRHG